MTGYIIIPVEEGKVTGESGVHPGLDCQGWVVFNKEWLSLAVGALRKFCASGGGGGGVSFRGYMQKNDVRKAQRWLREGLHNNTLYSFVSVLVD